MSANKLIRFYEHDRVFFHESYSLVGSDTPFVIDEKYQISLAIFHEKGGNNYYSLQHNGIKFKQFVGAIQVHDLTIEVLPKIDRDYNIESVDQKSLWHGVLLDMLKACKKLEPKSFQSAALKLRPNSILELYIELFVSEMEFILHSGLIKKYRKEEGNQLALRGSLLFAKQIQYNLVHAERFYTRHTKYDVLHLVHQVLRQALLVCDQLINSGRLPDRIKRLLMLWPESKLVGIYPALFSKFDKDRKLKPYLEAINIAKLLLLNYHPDIKGGSDNVLALMFDMNKLWEEFVYVRLKSCESELGIQVQQQTRVNIWESEAGMKQVKPDLLITYAGKSIIIDTKWKNPGEYKPSDDDLKQMLVYKLYYHADHALLLYPHSNESLTVSGVFINDLHHSAKDLGNHALKENLNLFCGMGFINVVQQNKLLDHQQFNDAFQEILRG